MLALWMAPTARRAAVAVAPATDLSALRNLGPRSAAILAAAGIATLAQLRRLGAVAAFVRARRHDAAVSLNLLYALAGALDGVHWRQVQRERRLELLTAVEDYERAHPAPTSHDRELLTLRNIGPAMKRDFDRLGIRSRAQLARADADALYLKLQRLTGQRQDPCVWDTFAAAIHQARTGEALPWWQFTRTRKQRTAEGCFPAASPKTRGAARAQRPTAASSPPPRRSTAQRRATRRENRT
jgi:predicted flap endonuclease-1-like 5' DNA nuclease